MIKGKGRREMPFFCKIVFTNHRFSKQMLKNQVLKIFFLGKYLVVRKKGFTFASPNNKKQQ